MKKMIAIILLLSSVARAVVLGVHGDSLVTSYTNIDYTISDLVTFNSNIGDVSTEIKIPLPKGLKISIKDSLNLKYSFSSHNWGMGIGMSWDLPELFFDPKNPRAKFILKVENISSEMIVFSETSELVEYRELALQTFVRLFYSKVTKKYSLVLPNGNKWLFDSDRNPILNEDSFGNYIRFLWKENLLQQISFSYTKNTIEFTYGSCKIQDSFDSYRLPFSYRGRMYQGSMCLQKMSGGIESINFYYNDSLNLIKVHGSESKRSYFHGNYQKLVDNTKKDSCASNPTLNKASFEKSFFRRNGGSQFVDTNSLHQIVGLSSPYLYNDLRNCQVDAEGQHFNSLVGDLNNDGVDDLLISSYSIRKSFNNNSCQEFTVGKIQIGVYFQTEGSFIYYPFNQKQRNVIEQIPEGDLNNNYSYGTSSTNQRVNFQIMSDLDGDSFLDIFSCRDGAAYWLKNLKNGMFSNPEKIDGVACDNFDMNLYNEKRNDDNYFELQDITAQTIIIDLNQDGYPDIVTANTIYLNLGNPNNLTFMKLSNSSELLKQWQLKLVKDIKDKKKGVFRMDSESIYPTIDSNYSHRTDYERNGKTQLWNSLDGSCLEEPIFIKHLILTSMETDYGGRVELTFDLTPYGPQVNRISKYALSQDRKSKDFTTVSVQNYKYHYPIVDKKTRQFLGYRVVEVITDPMNIDNTRAVELGGREITIYGTDDVNMYDSERAPLIGIPVLKYICEYNKCSDLPKTLFLGNEKQDWMKKEVYKYKRFMAKDLLGYNAPDSSFQYYVAKVSSESMLMKIEGTIDTPLETRYSFYRFSPLGATQIQIEKIGHGLENQAGPQFGKNRYEKIVSTYRIFGDELVPLSKTTYGLRSIDHQGTPVEELIYQFSGDKKSGGLNYKIFRSGIPLHTYIYDSKGRKLLEKNFDGLETNYQYDDESLKLTESTARMSEVFMFDSGGFIISSEKRAKNIQPQVIKIDRRPDGIPTLIQFMSQKYQYIETKLNPGLQVDIKDGASGKVLRKIFYDGFGRRLSEWKPFGDQWLLIQGNIPGEINPLIQFQNAIYSDFQVIPSGRKSEKIYDALGRMTYETQLSSTEAIPRATRNFYNGSCKKSFLINGSFERLMKTSCQDELGDLESISIGREDSIRIRREVQGDILNVGNIEYNYDNHHRIINIHSNKQKLNEVNYSLDHLIADYSNQFSTQKNVYNETTHTSLRNELTSQTIYDNFGRIQNQDSFSFHAEHSYNEDNQRVSTVISSMGRQVTQSFEYNQNLLTKVKNNFGFLQNLDLELEWDNFKLLAVSPFLKKLDYNSNGDIDKITYDNGLIVNFKFADDGKSLGLSYVDPKNQEERVENLTWNRYDLISTKNGNLTSEKITSYRYIYNSNFELSKTETQNSTNTLTIVSDSPFKADSYNKTPLDVQIENDLVSRIDGYTIKYGGLYSIAGVSKGIYKEVYVADDVHVINQHIIEYVRLADRFVGVIIHGPKIRGFFPIITDHLNSVRVIFDKSGAPLVQREYDSWGNAYFEKTDGDQGKILSQLIRYDFAGLIRPFGSRYLIARHRVYAPHLGRWLTLDPMLQWDPKKMIKNHSQELDGYKYALGNPVVFIDKTGTFATLLPAFGAGFVAGGTTFGYQYLMNGHDAGSAARDGLVAGMTTIFVVGTGGIGGGTLGANLAAGTMGSGINEGYNIYKGGEFDFSRWLSGVVGNSLGGVVLQYIPLRAEGLTLGGEIALEGVKSFTQTQGAFLYDILTQGSSHKDGVRNDYSEQVTIDKKESMSLSDYSGQYMCPIDGESPKK